MEPPMIPGEKTARPPRAKSVTRPESHAGVRYRAPFALRCGALLIDYILLALILTFSIMMPRLMGGGARGLRGLIGGTMVVGGPGSPAAAPARKPRVQGAQS